MVPTDVELKHVSMFFSLKTMKARYEFKIYKFVLTESARDMGVLYLIF